MANKFQMIHSYVSDNGRFPGTKTSKSSFKTIESATKNAYFWINKEESWIDVTTTELTIRNKETGETVFEYKKGAGT